MPRLFIAVDLPEEQAAALQALKEEKLNARWTPQEQYHITLRFIGDVDDATASQIAAALREITLQGFELRGEGLDVFPSRRRPRVLVAAIDDHPRLHRLKEETDRVVNRFVEEENSKTFHPHVTFGRLKRGRPQDIRSYLKDRASFRLDPFPIREFRLYRSDLGAGGAVHTVLESYPLTLEPA